MHDPEQAYRDGLDQIERRLQELREDGRRLQERRMARKFTVTRLAVLAGVREEDLANWDRGAAAPSPNDRIKVEALLSAWEHEGRFFSRHPARHESALAIDPERLMRERLLDHEQHQRSA